jgi:hypothetical protein
LLSCVSVSFLPSVAPGGPILRIPFESLRTLPALYLSGYFVASVPLKSFIAPEKTHSSGMYWDM